MMRGRTLIAVAAPLGLLLGLAGARFADPAMQDRAINPYVDDGRAAFALQERPRQPVYDVAPQDLDPHGSYRPDFDYDAEVWDSDLARMEAERRGFHIDDYYAERDAERAETERLAAAQPSADAAARDATLAMTVRTGDAVADRPAYRPAEPQQVRVTSGNDTSDAKPEQLSAPQDTDGLPAVY